MRTEDVTSAKLLSKSCINEGFNLDAWPRHPFISRETKNNCRQETNLENKMGEKRKRESLNCCLDRANIRRRETEVWRADP